MPRGGYDADGEYCEEPGHCRRTIYPWSEDDSALYEECHCGNCQPLLDHEMELQNEEEETTDG